MKIAVLPVSLSDASRQTEFTTAWLQRVSRYVAAYFARQSGDRVNMDISVFDWKELSLSQQQWIDEKDGIWSKVKPELVALHANDFSGIDHFVVIIDDQKSSLGATWGEVTLIAGISFTPAIMAHELAHTFGLGESLRETADGVELYGSPFSLMGFENTKYTFFETELLDPAAGGDEPFTASGPGLSVAELVQAGWLDIDQHCHSVKDFAGKGYHAQVVLVQLDGAPPAGASRKVGCIIEDSDRYVVEYRHDHVVWDRGIRNWLPGSDGWLVVYRAPVAGPLVAAQIAAAPATAGTSLAIDESPANLYLFGGGPLRLSIMGIDPHSSAVYLRIDRTKGKPPQYFPTEGLMDFRWWNRLLVQDNPVVDEPLDELSRAVSSLATVRRLARIGGPRLAAGLEEAARAKIEDIRAQLDRLDR